MTESSQHLLNNFFENQLSIGEQAFFFKECNPSKLNHWQVRTDNSDVYEVAHVNVFQPPVRAIGEFCVKQWCFVMKKAGQAQIVFELLNPDSQRIEKQIEVRLSVSESTPVSKT